VAADLLAELTDAGVVAGDALALVLVPGAGLAVAIPSGHRSGETVRVLSHASTQPHQLVAAVEAELRPRWVLWDSRGPTALLAEGVRVGRCWDLAAVHRLLNGGWKSDAGRVWAALRGLDESLLPDAGQLDLLGPSGDSDGDPEQPVQPDGHLRPGWISGGWSSSPSRWGAWAELAAHAFTGQSEAVDQLGASEADSERDDEHSTPAQLRATCQSESAAELLCVELARDGLPVDRARAEQLIASFIGPRPRDQAHARELRQERDARVLAQVPGVSVDLRSPAQVKAMLARVGIEVANTRSWRLEVFRDAHPVVPALLQWRKDERMSTTYGYEWLDRQLGPDGRLRGTWTSCDGGAGRMTASAGLHSLPADLRDAVRAEAGHRFVRADLGQIEPRVLAAVSGDRALAAATTDDDLYAPVAARLDVSRSVAKVAVLAAMYGQTSGAAGEALKGLERAYPVAMRYLMQANEAGRAGRQFRTYGGRLLRMWGDPVGVAESEARAQLAGRGRYARNAVVQGAAAELFKAWAATVRTRSTPLGATIVLCLHDELLVHVPTAEADATAELLRHCLIEAGRRWTGGAAVRFVADVSVIERWSQAKA
jgi:DNA polymerase-1